MCPERHLKFHHTAIVIQFPLSPQVVMLFVPFGRGRSPQTQLPSVQLGFYFSAIWCTARTPRPLHTPPRETSRKLSWRATHKVPAVRQQQRFYCSRPHNSNGLESHHWIENSDKKKIFWWSERYTGYEFTVSQKDSLSRSIIDKRPHSNSRWSFLAALHVLNGISSSFITPESLLYAF